MPSPKTPLDRVSTGPSKHLDPVKMADGGEVEDSEDTDQRTSVKKMSHMDQPSTDDAFAKAMWLKSRVLAHLRGYTSPMPQARSMPPIKKSLPHTAARLGTFCLVCPRSKLESKPTLFSACGVQKMLRHRPYRSIRCSTPEIMRRDICQHTGHKRNASPLRSNHRYSPLLWHPKAVSTGVGHSRKPQAPQAAQPGLYGNIPDDPFCRTNGTNAEGH